MGWGQVGVPGEPQKYTDLSIHQSPLWGPSCPLPLSLVLGRKMLLGGLRSKAGTGTGMNVPGF